MCVFYCSWGALHYFIQYYMEYGVCFKKKLLFPNHSVLPGLRFIQKNLYFFQTSLQLRIVTSRSSKEYNLGLNATALRLRQSLKGIIIPDLEILHISSIYLNKEKKVYSFLYSYFETNKSETKLNDLPLSTSFFKSE